MHLFGQALLHCGVKLIPGMTLTAAVLLGQRRDAFQKFFLVDDEFFITRVLDILLFVFSVIGRVISINGFFQAHL